MGITFGKFESKFRLLRLRKCFWTWSTKWQSFYLGLNVLIIVLGHLQAGLILASSQWETSLQSNAVSHWLDASLESALCKHSNGHVRVDWRNTHRTRHYSDAIMSTMASQITTASRVFTQPFVQAQIKENIKAPHRWPLWGEFTDDRWIPRTKASNAENASIWWRHHVMLQHYGILTLLGTRMLYSLKGAWRR